MEEISGVDQCVADQLRGRAVSMAKTTDCQGASGKQEMVDRVEMGGHG